MATKKSSGKGPKHSYNVKKARSLWSALSSSSWLEILSKFKSSHRWHEKNRNDLWGQCIKHDEDTASFHINLAKGYAHCFGCHYHETDPIAVIGQVMAKSYSEAFSYVINQYGPIQGLSTASIKDAQRYENTQRVKSLTSVFLNNELVDAAGSYLSGDIDPKYNYAVPCLEYLAGRGVPLGLLHALPLGIVCPAGALYDRLRAYEKQNNTSVTKDVQDYLEPIIPKGSGRQSTCEGWLVFVNHVSTTSIGSFRIREPSTDRKNIFALEEKDGGPQGFFGLGTPIFLPLIGTTNVNAKTVTVVEGEFDALSCVIPQVTTGNLSTVCISANGNANVSLDLLSSCGFETVHYIADWDAAGDTVLQNKLKATTQLKFRIFNPPDAFRQVGKDLHDVFLSIGGPNLVAEVTETGNFVFPYEWAIQKTVDECVDFPEADIRSRTQIAHTYAKILVDEAERHAYINTVAQAIGVDPETLKRYATPDTEEGFIELAANYLATVYEPIYQESLPMGKRVVAWNKQSKTRAIFDLSRGSSLLSVLRLDLGPVIDWIETEVGVPPEMQATVSEDGTVLERTREKKHRFYGGSLENDIFPRLLHRANLREKTDMTSIGQGIHLPDKKRVYVINGNLSLKGELSEAGAYEWQELNVPRDEEYLFATESRHPWSAALNSAEDLSKETKPFSELFAQCCSVFDRGFRFVNHELECQYLAAFLLAAPLIDLFDHVPWIFINGPTNTGKSSLNQVLASQNTRSREVTLFEHAVSLDNATPAGVKQTMKGTTLTLALDEFEVGPDTSYEAKHLRCREILELIRGAMGRGSRVAMGSARGDPVFWTLRFPFIASGIYTFHKTEDTNRFNTIEMATKDPDLAKVKSSTPKYLILNQHPLAELDGIRQNITLSVLRHITDVRAAYELIKKEFAQGAYTAPGTSSRFREQLLPILAVMCVAGQDYKKFATDYTYLKAERIAETSYNYKHEMLWQDLLHTNAIHIPGEEMANQTYTLSQLLKDNHRRNTLNLTNTGIFYLANAELLAVVWPTAIRGPLLRHSRFAAYGSPEKLRAIMQQDPRVVDDASRAKHRNTIKELTTLAGRLAWKDVSFIPIKELIDLSSQFTSSEDNLIQDPKLNLNKLKKLNEELVAITGIDNI